MMEQVQPQNSFVYVHLESDTGHPFYVGMGKRNTRPKQLYNRSKYHKNIVAKHGIRIELLVDNLTWENACFWEIRWIKALRDLGYRLVNKTNGGEGTVGCFPSEETKQKMRGPRPIISLQRKGQWIGALNPNKKAFNKEKLSIRMKENNPLFNPDVVALRSGENHHSKKDGWINPNLGKPNLAAKNRMLINNPMKNSHIANEASSKRKENGHSWEGNKNPSRNMSSEKLSNRGQKSAATRLLRGIVIPSNAKKVICKTDKNIFESLCAAARYYGLSAQGIGKVCLGKRQKISGLVFAYFEGEA